MLLFKKKYLDLIKSGRKTQTIRVWQRRRLKSGQRSYIPGIGAVMIHEVRPVALEELTEDDAVRDGFDSLAELLVELETLYANRLAEGQKPYRIRFEVMDATPARRSRRMA